MNHMNVKTCSSEALSLLPAPHTVRTCASKSDTFRPRGISRTGTECELQAYSRRATGLQCIHLRAIAVLPRGTKPARQHTSSKSDASSRELRLLAHPVHTCPSSTEEGGANMLHITGTGKVRKPPPAKVCLKTNSGWTTSYLYS